MIAAAFLLGYVFGALTLVAVVVAVTRGGERW